MLRRSRGSLDLMAECDARRNPVKSIPGKAADRSAVGLKIVIEMTSPKANVVIQSSLRSPRPNVLHSDAFPLRELDFLRSCYHCKKPLRPGMDVYIYRGDQGFCSVECRCHQIVLNERRQRCAAIMNGTVSPCGSGWRKIQTGGRKRVPAAA